MTTSLNDQWIAVAKTHEFQKPPLIRLIPEIRDELVLSFTPEGRAQARSSVCPHAGGSFAYHSRSRQLVCEWHKLRFDLDSGKCQDNFAMCLPEYVCKVSDDTLHVLIPRKLRHENC